MANSKIPNLNLSDTLNTQRLKFNQLLDSVGDVSTLTTTGTDVTSAVNEIDAELGTISAGAMGTTASTVSGAIAELDGRLDSINTTELLSPRATLSDSSATNIVRGNLQVDTNLHVNGNTTMSGTLSVDGQVTFKAGSDNNIALGDAATDTITLTGEVNSNIIPDGDNDYDLGSPTKEWRHVYVDGTVNADNLAADSATIASNMSVGGTLDVTGDTTLSNTITVQDSAYITGNLDLGSNLDVAGNVNVTGTVVSEGALTVEDSAYVTGNLDVGGNVTVGGDTTFANTITVQDSAYVTGNLDIGGNVSVTGDTTFSNTITVQDSAYITSNLDVGGALTAGTTTLGTTTASSASITDLTDNRVVIAGASGELEDDANLTYDGTDLSTNSLVVTDLTDNRILVAGTGGAVEDDGNLTWDGSTLDVTGDLSVSAGFTVGGTFTTTGNTRGQAAYVVVNDGVAVANGNRAGLAVDRPSNDSAVIQWNELGDYWEAGTTAGFERLALQNDSAVFNNIYAPGSNTLGSTTMSSAKVSDLTNNRVVIAGTSGELEDDANLTFDGTTFNIGTNTVINNALTVQDSAYVTGNLEVGGNLTVQGTTTVLNTQTVEIEDNVMLINSNQTGTPATSLRSGLEVERGSSTNVNLQWNENSDYWEAAEDGSNTLGRVATSGWLDATAPISFNSSTGNISHDNTTRSDTTTAATLAHSDAFEVVDSIQSNSKGHITGVNTRTITLPAGAVPNDATITLNARYGLKTGGNFTTNQSGNETIHFDIDSSEVQSYYGIPLLNGNPSTGTFWYDGLNSVSNSSGVSKMIIGNSSYDWDDNGTPTLELRQYGYSSSVGGGGVAAEVLGRHKINFTYKQQNTASGGDETSVDVTMADISTDIEHTSTSKVQRGSLALAAYTTTTTNGVTDETAKLLLGSGSTYTDATLSADGDIYLKPTGDDVFMQGTTSGEQLQFNLTLTNQSITASDNLRLTATGDVYIVPTGDNVFMQGTSSNEQLNFNLTSGIQQTIEASDALKLKTGTTSALDLTLDAHGDIILDADGNNIYFTNGAGGDTWTWTLSDDATASFSSPGNFTLGTTSGDIYLQPTGDDVYMQGTSSGEQLQFNLGASAQTITASDTLAFATDNLQFDFSSETVDGTSRPLDINIIQTDTAVIDGQEIGQISFQAKNSASEDVNYAHIRADTADVTDGTEDGYFEIGIRSDGQHKSVFTATGNSNTFIGGEFGVTLRADDGNVYMNVVSGAEIHFDIDASSQNIIASHALNVGATGGDLTLYTTTSGDVDLNPASGRIGLFDNGTERAGFDVNTSSQLKVYTGSNFGTLNSTFSSDDLTVQGDITSISDVRTKENIETIENGLEIVESLRGVYYNKIGEEDRKVGVVAQETEEVLPEVVLTDEEGMKSVDYGKMVGVLIEAIKDLKAEVEELKANKCNCGE